VGDKIRGSADCRLSLNQNQLLCTSLKLEWDGVKRGSTLWQVKDVIGGVRWQADTE